MTDDDMEILKRHAAMLSEHFDTVQIFTTRHDQEAEQTAGFAFGVGNYYARMGQVEQWLQRQEEVPEEEDDNT